MLNVIHAKGIELSVTSILMLWYENLENTCSKIYMFLALLDCVNRAIAEVQASVIRKTHFLRNHQGN